MTVRDDLLARVDIVDVVGRYVQLRRGGKNRLGLCPFHKEKTPSFTVAEDKQIYKCFGCGKGGNAVNFVMEIERIDYRDAIKELARTVNFDLTPYQKNPEITEKRQQDREKLKLLNKRAQEYFMSQLSGSEAEKYIVERRKLTPATIADFGIGYAPESYLGLIEHLKTKGFSTEDMLQAGLVSQGSGGVVPFFRHRVTFPIVDHIGNIVGFGARALHGDQNPKYLNTTETPLYEKSQLLFGLDKTKQHIKDYGFIVVVEGYMDVIAMHQYGLPLAVATCGTALTPDHIKLLKRHTDQVVMLFDSDQAGFDATIRALKICYMSDVYPRAFGLPAPMKDVDERLTSTNGGITPEQLLKGSQEGFTFVLSQRASQLDIANPVFRKKFQQEMFEIIQTVDDRGIFALYMELLGKTFSLSVTEMQKEFANWLKNQKRGIHNKQPSQTISTVPDRLKLLAALCFQNYWSTLHQHEDLTKQMNLITSLMPLTRQPLFEQLVTDTLDDATLQELLTLQLRREHQITGLNNEKTAQLLVGFVKEQVRDLVRYAVKNPHLSPDQKDVVLQMVRKIG